MDNEGRATLTTMAVMFLMVATMFTSLVTMGQEGPDADRSGSRAEPDPWVLTSLGLERQAIFDMAIGEVDPTLPGPEIIVVGGGGIVTQYSSETFESKGLFSFLQTLQAVDIGDVSSVYPGNEIVTVGNEWKVHLMHRGSDGTWSSQTIWTSVGSINGVATGDFNSSHPGKEIAVTGDEAILAILTEDPSVSGGWAVTSMEVNPEGIPITNMMVHAEDLLPEWPGDEMLVASFSGHAYLVRQDGKGGYNITVIWRDEFATLGFGTGGDLVPNITGPEIYSCSFSGRIALIYHNGTNWTVEEIYQDRDPMYAVVPADVDPRYPGDELVALGIGNTSRGIHIIRYDETTGNWYRELVRDDKGPSERLLLLYDLQVAELDSGHEGLEIVFGGYFQELIELTYVEPDFSLEAMPTSQTVVSGDDAEFWIGVKAIGNFDGTVDMSTSTSEVTFEPQKAVPGDLVHVTVPTMGSDTGGTLSVTVTGSSGAITRSLELGITTVPRTTLAFDIELFPSAQTVMPGFSTTFVARINPINYFDGQVEISVEDLDERLDVDVEGTGMVDHPTLITVTATSVVDTRIPYWTDHFLIKGVGTLNESKGYSFTDYAVATVTVDTRELPDFIITVSPTHTMGITGSTVHFDLQLTTVNYFTGDVVLSVDGVPPGSHGSFSASIVTPPVKVRYSLELGPVFAAGTPVLTFKATGGGMTHYAAASIYHLYKGFERDFEVYVHPSSQVARPGGTISFLVEEAGNRTIEELEIDIDGLPFTATLSPGKGGNPQFKIMTVKVKANAVPGKYTGKVFARAGWEHNTTFNVIVDESNDIPIIFLEPEVLVSPGQNIHFTISGVGDWKFPGGRDVNIEMVGLSDSPDHITRYMAEGNSTLDVSFGHDRPNGTYLVAIVVGIDGMPYPKAVIGTVTITGPMPLLSISDLEAEGELREGRSIELTTKVTNLGVVDAHNVTVELIIDGTVVARKVVALIEAGTTKVVSVDWNAVGGKHNMSMVLSYDHAAEGEARIIDGIVEEEITVHGISMVGPSIAILLVLMFVGMTILMVSTSRMGRAKEPSVESIRKTVHQEEE